MTTTNASRRGPRTTAELIEDESQSAPRLEESKFIKGSIVSLHMVNFLVYKDVVALFGPRLNVVMGPNGSGKSTLVCAILLGLGGAPKVLGRASNLSAFVMHNVKEDASVTVELFMPEGPNLNIKRTFSRKNNTSIWHVNGRSLSDKQVKEKIADLGIQVDNLCTMLPQDKVGSFSELSPDKLLLETQQALSSDRLYEPHLKLIEMQESAGKKVNEEDMLETNLETSKAELAKLQHDVQLFQERQEKQDKLEFHKKRKVWLKVEKLREEGKKCTRECKAAEAELRQAEKEDAPLREKQRTWEREFERTRGVVDNRMKKRLELQKNINTACAKVERLVQEAKSHKSEIANIETRRVKKEEHLVKIKAELKTREDKLEGIRESNASGPSKEELMADIRAISKDQDEVKQDLEAQQAIARNALMDIRVIDEKIKQLTNLQAVRQQKFLRHFRENAQVGLKVRDWAARNSDKLMGPVTGPIGLEVTVDDPEAATAVETHVPSHMWCSLVVDFKEDHDTIIREFSNQRLPISIFVNEGGGLKPQQPIFSNSEIANLKRTAGVRGFLDDFITCPDTIRQTLRRNVKIHRTFLGSAATQNKITTDPSFLPSLGKSVRGVPTGSMIYAGGEHERSGSQAVEPLQQYQTKISLYGQKRPSVRVVETRPAQVVGRGLDEEAVEEQRQEIARREGCHRAAADKAKKIQVTLRDLEEQGEEANNSFHNSQAHKKAEKAMVQRIEKSKGSIKDIEEDLARGGDAEKKLKIHRLEKVFEQHAISVDSAQGNLSLMLDAAIKYMAANLAKQVSSDKLTGIKEALLKAQDSRINLEKTVDNLKRSMSHIRKEFQAQKAKANNTASRFVNGFDGEKTEFGKQYNNLPDSLEELEAVIEGLNEDLKQTTHNPQVLHTYEQLKQKVAELQDELDELKETNANASQTMEAVRQPWNELLENMVIKLDILFSEYMSKMDGCQGRVTLAKDDESFKKWGIEIVVRFRSENDGGKEAVLNKYVHSGGERSVSTILFLMALQDLQQSPFRVVDEINQGMDPKNERGVFSRIVLNSCGPTRKQYFLITPKLLQGLVAMDKDDVTVHVVMNGMHSIRGTPEHSMQNFIEAKKRRRELQAGDGRGSAAKNPRH